MGRLLLFFGIICQIQAAVVIDRIAVVVGRQAIKLSDIDRDLRLTEFLNNMPLDLSGAAKKKSAERLIDQAVIRDAIATGGYNRATDADAENMLAQIRKDRFAGSDARLKQGLMHYGLSEDDLRAQLLWQMTVLHFIDERFRPGVVVSDQQARAYYDQHLAQLRRENPANNSFPAVEQKIRDILAGEEVNKQFEAWLDMVRKEQRVEYKQEAFG
jgi:peptidyl-prolyl cis-trans isomerase SurA